MAKRHPNEADNDVRSRILKTASSLFYKRGVRAVGIDLVIEEAGVAKASLYRHFESKDDLIVAFLEVADRNFWIAWDLVAETHASDPRAELDAHLLWIGQRAGQPNYRGCAQINAMAEFPDLTHPARKIAKAHKLEMRRRLGVLAKRLGAEDPDGLAGKLAVLINGAFVSSQMFKSGEATGLLREAAEALLCASIPKPA